MLSNYRQTYHSRTTRSHQRNKNILTLPLRSLVLICCITMFTQIVHANNMFISASEQVKHILESANDMQWASPDAALTRAQDALEKSLASNDRAGQIYALVLIGNILDALNRDNEANTYYQQALSLDLATIELSNNTSILIMLTNALRSMQKYQQAQHYIDKAITLSDRDDTDYLMRAYTQKAIIYLRQKQYQESMTIGSEALNLVNSDSAPRDVIELNYVMAEAARKSSDHSKSKKHNQIALAYAKNINDQQLTAQFLTSLSADQIAFAEYSQALINSRAALRIQREFSDAAQLSKTLLNISVIYMRLTRYDQSLAYALELLSVDEQIGDLARIASSCNQVGRIYERLKQFNDAKEYYERTLALDENAVDARYRASALRSMASIKGKQKDLIAALDYAKRSHDIYSKIRNLRGLASVERAIANIYKDMGEKMLAIQHHRNAIDIATKLGDKWSETSSLIHMGTIQITSDPDQARLNIEKGLKFANQLKSKSLQLDAYKGLIILERGANNPTKALSFYDKAYKLVQEIDNKEIDDRIAELKVIHETEQTEREIEELKRTKYINEIDLKRKNAELENLNSKNTIAALKLKEERFSRIFFIALTVLIGVILAFVLMRYKYLTHAQKILNEKHLEVEKKNISLEELNVTKNRFFSIISHDLRSPITAIVGLSDMLVDNFDEFDEKELKQHIESINNASNQTFGLLENLLSWAVLQLRNTDPIPRQYSLYELSQTAIRHVKTTADLKDITIKNNIKATTMIYADKNMVTTVLRNLVANAIKFTPHDGTISLYCEENDNQINVHIKDSGVGIDQDTQAKLFKMDELVSKKGTDGEAGTGFGLALCYDLIKKNKGELKMTSVIGEGSDFYFVLPKTD